MTWLRGHNKMGTPGEQVGCFGTMESRIVVIWAGSVCGAASSFVFCIVTMVPCRLSCHNGCTSVKSFDLCRRFCRYPDPGSHILNQPSHTSPKGLADLSQKKIADYLSKSSRSRQHPPQNNIDVFGIDVCVGTEANKLHWSGQRNETPVKTGGVLMLLIK